MSGKNATVAYRWRPVHFGSLTGAMTTRTLSDANEKPVIELPPSCEPRSGLLHPGHLGGLTRWGNQLEQEAFSLALRFPAPGSPSDR
jgi:hypothetical protein